MNNYYCYKVLGKTTNIFGINYTFYYINDLEKKMFEILIEGALL